MSSHNPYSSGKYYRERYVPLTMNLEQSTRWSSNYWAVVKSVFPRINDFKDKPILEVGSGFGGFINNLNRNGFRDVTASDVSEIIFSNELKNKFTKLDLTDNQYLGERYDIIFAFDVMEHINETETAIANIAAILKNGGYFVFSVPYPIKKHLLDNYHTNMQFSNYYTNLFRQNGFRLEAMEETSFIPFVWRFRVPLFIKTIVSNYLLVSETFFVFRKSKLL